MCQTVVLPTGEWLTGGGELDAVGWTVTEAEWLDDTPIDLDLCTCSIDVEALLERLDVKWTSADGGAFIDVDETSGPTAEQLDALTDHQAMLFRKYQT